MKSTNNTKEEQKITLEDTKGRDPQDFPREVWEELGFQLEPMKAIRAQCIGCSGGSRSEVRKCQVTSCPNYPLRMGYRPQPSDKQSKEIQLDLLHRSMDDQGSKEGINE